MISQSLQISYDEQGNKYDLPIFVLNPPEKYEIKKEENLNYNGKKIKVKLQFLQHLNEFEINLDDLVQTLVVKAKDMIKKNEPFDENVSTARLVYQGKVFKEELKLGAYLKADCIVQIFKTMKK